MSDDFITIREATELTGKADITIRRLIKHLISQNNPEATQMIKQEQGKIVSIASLAGHSGQGVPNLGAYSAAKAGVLQLTSVLALELGRYNINVNAVSPGVTVTPLVQELLKAHPDLLSGQLKAVPLKKAGKPRAAYPEDQANAVLFLVSPESDYISGQEIMVDGGSHNIHPGWISGLE